LFGTAKVVGYFSNPKQKSRKI